MRDDEEKVTEGGGGRARTGSGIRAKNRTVIMGAEETSGVRARLGGEFKSASGSGRVGGLDDPSVGGDPSWERPQVSSDMLVERAPEGMDEAEAPVDPAEEPAYVQAEPAVPQGGAHDEAPTQPEMLGELTDDPLARFLAEPNDPLPQEDIPYEREATAQHGAGRVEEPPEAQAPAEVAPVARIVRTVGPRSGAPQFTQDPPPQPVTFVAEEEPMTATDSDKPEAIFWKNMSQLVGFLVSFDHEARGSYVELRVGRLIVSSQPDPSSNCLVIRDESVSPMHAVMRVAAGGAVQVLDQLSETGTRIRKGDTGEELLLSGEKTTLAHGDVVWFGDRAFSVCLIMMAGSE